MNRHMERAEWLRRYALFLFACVVAGIGTAGIAQSRLGVSPYSTLSYEISLHTPWTLGMVLFAFNAVLIALQFLLLTAADRSRTSYLILLSQFGVNLLFSASVDIPMWLMSRLIPEAWYDIYAFKITLLLTAIVVTIVGVCLQIVAAVSMLSYTAFTNVLAKRLGHSFGFVKLFVDAAMVVAALALFVCYSGTQWELLESVREGTIIQAMIAGPLARLILPRLMPLNAYLVAQRRPEAVPAMEHGDFQRVITISREYGTGGLDLARELSERLGIPVYDKDIIEMVAQESGLSPEYVRSNEAPTAHSLLFDMVMHEDHSPLQTPLSAQDALFVATSRVIRRLAHEQPCIFVGRLAEVILRDNPHRVSVFLHAKLSYRIRRLSDSTQLSRRDAARAIRDNDRRRAWYHYHYTGRHISDSRNYDLALDIESLGRERTLALICELYRGV